MVVKIINNNNNHPYTPDAINKLITYKSRISLAYYISDVIKRDRTSEG